MEKIATPGKLQVRDWLRSRQTERSPLPGQEQILCAVGWKQSGAGERKADVPAAAVQAAGKRWQDSASAA